MSAHRVRKLRSDDFAVIMTLEESIFGAAGEGVLGPYYVRLCCDFFYDSCFIATVDEQAAGYLLSFIRDREAYCTTLAVVPEWQGTKVVHRLIREFVRAIAPRVDSCWFTVKEDNQAARAVHAALGAQVVGRKRDFYGPGDDRLVSRVDRETFDKLRARYERLGLIEGEASGAKRREAAKVAADAVRSS
jgi:ribosomal protein S18 acetylase RimI-like enzyme